LVAVLHPERRRYFASPAPYLTNVIGMLALAPHVWWTIGAGFPTVEYAISRTEFEVEIARATSIKAMCGAVAALGVAAAVYAFAFGAQSSTLLGRSMAASFNRQYAWLTCLAYGPLLLTIAAYVFLNARIASGFLLPAFFSLPVVFLVLSRANITGTVIRKMVYSVAAIWLTLVAASPIIAYYDFVVSEQEHFEPRREVAVEATRLWNKTVGKPLRYVSGDSRLATAVTFYSPDSPSYFIYHNPEQSPWATIAQTHNEGVLLICNEITDWCIRGVEAFAGPTAIRSTLELATHFLGREGRSHRFVLFMRPPG
jgi:hypothetical protein